LETQRLRDTAFTAAHLSEPLIREAAPEDQSHDSTEIHQKLGLQTEFQRDWIETQSNTEI